MNRRDGVPLPEPKAADLRPQPYRMRMRAVSGALDSLKKESEGLTRYQREMRPSDKQLQCYSDAISILERLLRASWFDVMKEKVIYNQCSECDRKLSNGEPIMHQPYNNEKTCLSCHIRIFGQLDSRQAGQLEAIMHENREVIRNENREESSGEIEQ